MPSTYPITRQSFGPAMLAARSPKIPPPSYVVSSLSLLRPHRSIANKRLTEGKTNTP